MSNDDKAINSQIQHARDVISGIENSNDPALQREVARQEQYVKGLEAERRAEQQARREQQDRDRRDKK